MYEVGVLSKEVELLWTVFVTLLALWLLGIVSANTFGGFIHVLLWAAIAVVLLRVIQGRPKVS
ncbi:MAG TPA: lmo0937 family membrane protein [Gemmatimonadales bacterium]|nr:lmo0937 family membrane protein [Gemmatimonadales bacterium]